MTKYGKQLHQIHDAGVNVYNFFLVDFKNVKSHFMDSRTQFNTARHEIEANRFAMNMLLSDLDIEKHLNFITTQLSCLFGYNKNLIGLRMNHFN